MTFEKIFLSHIFLFCYLLLVFVSENSTKDQKDKKIERRKH